MCHFSVCKFEQSEAIFLSVGSTVWRAGGFCWGSSNVWASGWWLKTETGQGATEVSRTDPAHRQGDKTSVLSINNGHVGHPILCTELSEVTAPDWLLSDWCNGDSGCLCSLWSWGPLLLQVTGKCGLFSKTPNDVCVALTGSLLLPWWLLSPSNDPYESHSKASPREPVGNHLLTFCIYSTSQGRLERALEKW